MAASYHRVLFVFVDGVGLAPEGPDNPLSGAATPELASLLGGALTADRLQRGPGLLLDALDACLGVEGLPQSGTGQASLFTGINAAAHVGHHVPALPGARLRALIAEHSMLRRLARRGLSVTFANPYTPGYLAALDSGALRSSATTAAVRAAEIPLRGLDELGRDEAVTWDVCRDLFARRAEVEVPTIGPEVAGRQLGSLAAHHDFTLFETFLTDLAGHHRWGITAADALARLDGLLAGVLAVRPPELSLVMTSDHGNLENAASRSHTRNPVPLLVVGPLAGSLVGVQSIDRLAPRIEALVATAAPF